MFAVELGASILMQFETETGRVAVLADAGEARHDVNARLPEAFETFEDGERFHIELMIGTHYDSDHLAGLVAIINDDNVTIGEAWLPPVANDAEPRHGRLVEDANLLALQFANPDGQAVLERYLNYKAGICDQLASAERRGDQYRAIERSVRLDPEITLRPFDLRRPADSIARYEANFLAHIEDANHSLGIDGDNHADEQYAALGDDAVERLNQLRPRMAPFAAPDTRLSTELSALTEKWAVNPSRVPIETATLALVRKAHAKDAITASHLSKVVEALKARGVNIRCATIPDGKPQRFYWDAKAKRFTPTKRPDASGPEILLLGPSDGLVNKLRDQIPTGTYAFMAKLSDLPIKPITPSNQLSYIMVFEHAGQRLLITGDAGCVDFAPGSKQPYHPDLIKALSPFNVVQIAHHGGHNAHFYRCLTAADFPQGEPLSYLLLSHATHDKTRPSDVFTKFITNSGVTEYEVQLLFTSEPQEPKIRDLKPLIAPPAGRPAASGDVQLVYNGRWRVKRHAISL